MSAHNRSIKIFIDNSDAMSKSEDLRKNIRLLENDLKSLSQQGKKDTAAYKKSEKDLNELTNAYSTHQNKVSETERVLKNLSGATLPELYRTRALVRKELNKHTRGSAEHTKIMKIHNQVQKEISVATREMNSQYGAQATLMSRITTGARKYIGVATAFVASVTGMIFAIKRLSDVSAQMEDVYSDVMKTTSLTRDEVLELNEAFKQMDTRTPREQLNLLARDAGKLGIEGKQDILDFVEAANVIQVALGEDLGEDAIKSIGKMSEVFQKATKELDGLGLKERMLSIGSAVNEVAQSSSASEPYLVSFAGRLGGVSAQAGIGIDKILGYASALDQNMQSVEMSATTLQKFIMTIMSKPAEFAAVANMEVAAFSNLLKTDANEAIKLVLRSLNEKGGFQDLIPVFEEMGLSGTRAVGVLSSLASSVDKIDEAQRIANISMIEATSVLDEYAIKNENAAAQLAKQKQQISDVSEELGSKLLPVLVEGTSIYLKFLQAIPVIMDFFVKWGPLLVKTTAIIVTYNVALKATSLWKRIAIADSIKLHLLILREQAALTILAAKQVFAARTTRQLSATMQRLFATMSLNPFALIVTAVVALTYGLWKLSQESTKLLTKQNALIDATNKANKAIAGERAELDLLLAIARDENMQKGERLKAIEKLNKISPQYLGNLNLENINTKNATDSIKIYTDELLRNAKAKAIAEKVSESYAVVVENERIAQESLAEYNRLVAMNLGNTPAGNRAFKQYQQSQAIIDTKQKEIEVYTKLNNELAKNNKLNSGGDDGSAGSDGGSGSGTPPDVTSPGKDKDIYKEKLAVLDAYLSQEKNKLLQARYDGTINQEKYLRELEILEMDGLQKKMDIYELDSQQQIQVQNLIYEKKIAIMQKLQDEELAHQKKLSDIQKAADKARADQNWNALKAIAKQNEVDAKKAYEAQQEKVKELAELGIGFSTEMGTMIGSFISGNDDMVASALKSMINMALDALKMQVQMSIAGVTAQGLAQSMLNPAAMAKAAVKIALIEAAFAGVKAVISGALSNLGSGGKSATISDDALTGQRVVTQRQHGKYDVLGADDGRLYSNVPYIGDARTGVVSTPTLMGEYGGELVVNAPDFKALQRHVNYPVVLQAIQQSRQPHSVPQRADGNYSQLPPAPSAPQMDMRLMQEMTELLRHLKAHGVKAPIVLSELQAKQTLQETSQKIGSK